MIKNNRQLRIFNYDVTDVKLCRKKKVSLTEKAVK